MAVVHAFAAVPWLDYGSQAAVANCHTEAEVRSHLESFEGPGAIRWQWDLLAAANLSAFTTFVGAGIDKMGGKNLQDAIPLLSIQNHKTPVAASAFVRIQAACVPWGAIAEGPCTRASELGSCERCTARRGGFAFGWRGPWTCERVSVLEGTRSPDYVKYLWSTCSATGGCRACRTVAYASLRPS
jgi:hypothetical protein